MLFYLQKSMNQKPKKRIIQHRKKVFFSRRFPFKVMHKIGRFSDAKTCHFSSTKSFFFFRILRATIDAFWGQRNIKYSVFSH